MRFVVIATPYIYPNLLNKRHQPPLNASTKFFWLPLLIFVDVGEALNMADDVVTLSNPPIVPVEEEKLEETSLDVNVFQRLCDEKSFQRVVHIWINRSTWDFQSSPNPRALTIYLEFFPARGTAPKRF